ncbi:MAG TPA: Asp23/Gls24 family envelope stress response protein [Firmicutes bacterium]|uniref:Asp23/Gls24 family envelope stress response protein n=1 Tax=Capillibacterium thermochitinicola TaxID=2699427 RepID=A0A8J6LIQ5_9FIRM|nr:Asp23/Gls24 family envelope stress response protein [Capillibacterium thermochitinicola]HHW11790.1 Asp23/Gls24 family envelope stress response protein [Bacillota bacterium]
MEVAGVARDFNPEHEWDEKNGSIRIANEVVGVIAGLAAMEVKGVYGMSGGMVDGITELLKKKNLSKGVRVEVGEKEAAIDLSIIVEYGTKIPEVAVAVQENVKRAIESMTGLTVVEVNVHIQGVEFRQEEPVPEEKRVK